MSDTAAVTGIEVKEVTRVGDGWYKHTVFFKISGESAYLEYTATKELMDEKEMFQASLQSQCQDLAERLVRNRYRGLGK